MLLLFIIIVIIIIIIIIIIVFIIKQLVMVSKNFCDGGVMEGQLLLNFRVTCSLKKDLELIVIVVMTQLFSFLIHFRV